MNNQYEAFANAARAPIYVYDLLYSTVYGVYQSHTFRCDPQATNYYCPGSPQGQGDDNDRYILSSGVTNGSAVPTDAGLWADGNWHRYDFHIKMNSYAGNGVWNSDGMLEFWFDSIQQYSRSGMQWVQSGTDATIGWNTVEFGGNAYNTFANNIVMNHAYVVGNTIKYSGYNWTCIADNVLVNNTLPTFSGAETYWHKGAIISDEPIEQWYAVDDIVVSTTEIPADYVIGATPDPINGSCGMSSGSAFSTLNNTSANLCGSGNNVASFAGTGPWTWGCNGLNGGTNTAGKACAADYIAPPVPVTGVCGSANGGTFSSAPASNTLCSGGTAGIITGQYNWVCSGSGGGSNTNCSANYSTEISAVTANPIAGIYSYPRYITLSCSGACTNFQYCTSGDQCEPNSDYVSPLLINSSSVIRSRGGLSDSIETYYYTINPLLGPVARIFTGMFKAIFR